MNDEKLQALWDLCELFITEHRISCSETIYQSDRVIESAYVFIDNVADIVGFYDDGEDDDE